MTEKLVSIVMPAYNAGDCIEKSLGCILNQSYKNIELVVIDDGSKDDTAEKLRRLSEKDSRLKAFSVENGGPAKARNIALGHISEKSDYVMFADSDDQLLPDAVEYALKAAESGADMVIFGFTIVDAQGGERNYCERAQIIEREEFKDSFARLYKANLLNQVWGKLYKSSLIKENAVEFPDYRWGEDRIFIFDCLKHVKKLAVLPECKYRYIMQPGESLITKYYDKKFSVCKEIDRRVQEICRELQVEDDADFKYMYSKSVFSCITNMYSPSCKLKKEEKREAVKNIIEDPSIKQRCNKASGGLPVKILNACLRSGSPGLNLFAFKMVSVVGRKAPALFIKLKHKK